MKRRIVIDLYDHTSVAEIEDILETLRGVGLDPRLDAPVPKLTTAQQVLLLKAVARREGTVVDGRSSSAVAALDGLGLVTFRSARTAETGWTSLITVQATAVGVAVAASLSKEA